MGTSNPAPIKVVLNVNMPQNSIVSSVNSDTNDLTAAPLSSSSRIKLLLSTVL